VHHLLHFFFVTFVLPQCKFKLSKVNALVYTNANSQKSLP
jgi:hypothetical protein